MGGNKDNGIHTFKNLFHNLSNSDFTKEEKMVLALGLKYKPPQSQSSKQLSVVRQEVACYLNKIREAKIKAYCGELNKQIHPIYSRVTEYIYKLHYSNKYNNKIHKAITDNFGIPIESYIRKTEQ